MRRSEKLSLFWNNLASLPECRTTHILAADEKRSQSTIGNAGI